MIKLQYNSFAFGAVVGGLTALVKAEDLSNGNLVGVAAAAITGGACTKVMGEFIGGIVAYNVGGRISDLAANTYNDNVADTTEMSVLD